MKLLLDENLGHRLVVRLAEAFPGTASVDQIGLRGQPDTAIWDYAADQGFVIVSKDDDFRQLSFFRGYPPLLKTGGSCTGVFGNVAIGSRT